MTYTCETPLDNVAYLHDGTLEGLLSAVFLAYERHEQPYDIVPEGSYEPRLGQSCIYVETDFGRADRVRKGIERAAGKKSFTAIMRASTCDDYDTGVIVFRFVRYVMARNAQQRRNPVLDEMTNPIVADVLRLEKRVLNESERMRQFVRFAHLENGVWYARINPSASVVPLIMGYFAGRLNDQPFIIYDEAHHLAGIYDGRRWELARGDAVDVPAATDHDRLMQEAWKRFYDALSIDARYNPELRRHFMPVRLWRNLTEMQPRTSASHGRPDAKGMNPVALAADALAVGCATISERNAGVAQR